VIRAIDIVEQALAKLAPPSTFDTNRSQPPCRRKPARKGARFVEDLGSATGAITIFSAHGVARVVELDAQARGLHV
jgi:4-hydroxy-3-methylbut-2-enyl diphosphate reductase